MNKHIYGKFELFRLRKRTNVSQFYKAKEVAEYKMSFLNIFHAFA